MNIVNSIVQLETRRVSGSSLGKLKQAKIHCKHSIIVKIVSEIEKMLRNII